MILGGDIWVYPNAILVIPTGPHASAGLKKPYSDAAEPAREGRTRDTAQ